MKKCTQCAQVLSDETKFCFKCGGANFEPVEETNGSYQQPTYQQPSQQAPQQSYYAPQPAEPSYQQAPAYQQPSYQQPAYQQTANNEPVSVGMCLLFFIVAAIPFIGLIFAIIVAVSSSFKKSYVNMARGWLIYAAIGLVLTIIFAITAGAFISEYYNEFSNGFYNRFYNGL